MTNLSLEKIDQGIKLCIANCYSLLSDGELLYKNKRYPSAFALFQLCAEEQSKVKLLIEIACKKRADIEITEEDRKFYNKFFVNHIKKTRHSSASDYTFNQFAHKFGLNKIRSDKEIENEKSNPSVLNDLKKSAFYVSLKKQTFQMPSDVIDKKLCMEIRKNIKTIK